MPNVLSFIGSAWDFYRKQTMINLVIIWLYIVPITLLFASADVMNESSYLHYVFSREIGINDRSLFVLQLIVDFALSIWILWGTACVLIIGERMVKSAAGRARTSFGAVRKQATKYIVPLFLTDLLRDCLTLLWAILLIIPGIIFSIRTAFYAIIIVFEGKEYRSALNESKKIVQGHSWTVFWSLIMLGLIIFIPAILGMGFIQSMILTFDTRLSLVADILSSGCVSFAIVLFILSMVALYDHVKKLPSPSPTS